MAREDFAFVHPLRVRWAEADMQGVVFNGHYLTYFDVALTEYWRTISDGDGRLLREIFERLYVVKSTIDYHAPARFDELIDVCVRTVRIGNSSLRLAFEIHRGDEHLITGDTVYVHADAGRSVPVPPHLRERIVRFEHTPPQA